MSHKYYLPVILFSPCAQEDDALWHVVHSADGDEEDLDRAELIGALEHMEALEKKSQPVKAKSESLAANNGKLAAAFAASSKKAKVGAATVKKSKLPAQKPKAGAAPVKKGKPVHGGEKLMATFPAESLSGALFCLQQGPGRVGCLWCSGRVQTRYCTT